jgi:hypothetical protein
MIANFTNKICNFKLANAQLSHCLSSVELVTATATVLLSTTFNYSLSMNVPLIQP